MREILFRGKCKDTGRWYEGQYIHLHKTTHCFAGNDPDNDIHQIVFEKMTDWDLPNRHLRVDVLPETVGEFTGLYNGGKQRIFEDDIVRFEGNLYRVRREDETPGGYWASTAFILQHIGWDDYIRFVDTIDDYSNEICVEIIGNIHDNPELLKGGE